MGLARWSACPRKQRSPSRQKPSRAFHSREKRMARAYASRIIKAPVETVWSVVRDFNGLPDWAPDIVDSKIEGGLDADAVGCVRSFHTKDGTQVRERLLTLDDARYSF